MMTFGDSDDVGDSTSLRVYTLDGSQATAIFATDAKPLVAGPNEFQVRFKVAGGEYIGIVPGAPGRCGYPGFSPSDLYRFGTPVSSVGTPFTSTQNGPFRLDVAAVVEPDADGDGFGDESQDGCPSQADTQDTCDTTGPDPSIDKGPKRKTESRTARFRFTSDDPNATFQCRLDKKPFAACTSPKKYRKLKVRKHRFRVQATDSHGNHGLIESFRWRVVD
jgi:hypothetical protein